MQNITTNCFLSPLEQNIFGFSITFPFPSSGFTHNLSLTLSELYYNILWFYYLLDLVLIE